jgi:hypothetical protein
MSRLKEVGKYVRKHPKTIGSLTALPAVPFIFEQPLRFFIENPQLTATQAEGGALGSIGAMVLSAVGAGIIIWRDNSRNSNF